MKISEETKQKYCDKFWFMYENRVKYGENFINCSEEVAHSVLWELCERIQTYLTPPVKEQDKYYQNANIIVRFMPYYDDDDIWQSLKIVREWKQ